MPGTALADAAGKKDANELTLEDFRKPPRKMSHSREAE